MPDPLFNANDRPGQPPASTLPPELAGKSAEDVARYYQNQMRDAENRHATDLLRVRSATPAPPNPHTPPNPTEITMPTDKDFFNSPTDAAGKIVNKVVGDIVRQYDQASEPLRRNMIATAEMITERKFAGKKDASGRPLFERFHDEVLRYMSAFTPQNQADPNSWEVAFTHVVGLHVDELQAEAMRPRTTLSEPTSPGITEPPKPVELTLDEKRVAMNLGQSEDTYKRGKELLDKNSWPLTFSNAK